MKSKTMKGWVKRWKDKCKDERLSEKMKGWVQRWKDECKD